MVPIDAAANAGYFGMRHNGAFELRFFNWILTYGARDGSHEALSNAATKKALDEAAHHVREYVKPGLVEAMSTGDLNDFWKNMGSSVVDHVAEYKDIPVYHIGVVGTSFSGVVPGRSGRPGRRYN